MQLPEATPDAGGWETQDMALSTLVYADPNADMPDELDYNAYFCRFSSVVAMRRGRDCSEKETEMKKEDGV